MLKKETQTQITKSMNLERKHKNLNVISGLASTLITAMLAFIFTKFLIENVGTTFNGRQRLILTIVSYFSLAEGGLTIGMAAKLYKPLRDKDYDEVTRIFNGMGRIYKIIGFVYLSLGIVGSIIFSLATSGTGDPKTTWFIFSLFIINVIPGFLNYTFIAKYVTILQADNKKYWLNISLTIFKVFSYTTAILIISLISYDTVVVNQTIHGTTVKSKTLIINSKAIFALLAISIVEFATVVVYLGVRVIKREYFIEIINKDIKESKKMHSVVVYTFLYKLSTMIVFSTDAITLSFASSDQSKAYLMLTIYSLYSSVVSIFQNVFVAMIENTRSFIGRNLSSKEHKDRIIKELYKTSIIFACTILVVITVVTPVAIEMVFPSENYFMPVISLLLGITMFLYLLSTPARIIVEAYGDFKGTWIIITIEAIINLAISIGLVFSLNIYGVIIATIISMAFKLVAFEIYAYRKWDLTIIRKDNIKMLVLVFISLGFTAFSQWWMMTQHQSGFDFSNGWMNTWLNPFQLMIFGVVGVMSLWSLWFILKNKHGKQEEEVNETNS